MCAAASLPSGGSGRSTYPLPAPPSDTGTAVGVATDSLWAGGSAGSKATDDASSDSGTTRPETAAGRVAGSSQSLASVSIASAAAARASLLDKDLVPLRKKINADIRTETVEFLTKRGYKVIPGSQGNMFMVDAKRPGKEFQSAMLKENVAIGRTWSAMPNYVRVTVGTKAEMERFQTAFVKCMDMPAGAANGAAEMHMPEFHVPSELSRG